jgi:hypothetical protein
VAVESLSETIKARLRATGILEVTEAEYLNTQIQKQETKVESPDLPSGAPLAETPQSNPVEESLEEEVSQAFGFKDVGSSKNKRKK